MEESEACSSLDVVLCSTVAFLDEPLVEEPRSQLDILIAILTSKLFFWTNAILVKCSNLKVLLNPRHKQ